MEMAKLIVNMARKYNVSISPEQAAAMANFFKLILKYNEKYNLTRITDKREAVIKHFIDSIVVTKLVKFQHGDTVLDLGTGAGFPGVPLKIVVPWMHIYLIDSSRKKVNFLLDAVDKLALKQTNILYGRAEDLAHTVELRENFMYVIARAVAPLNILIELALPFVKVGGKCLAYKGKKIEKELEEAELAINLCGGKIANLYIEKIEGMDRAIVVIDKIKESPLNFPRRPGIPKKRPIK